MPDDTALPLTSGAEFRRYAAYGVSIRADMELPLPPGQSPALLELQIRGKTGAIPPSTRQKIEMQQNPFSALDAGCLPDGSNYAGLRDVGEFLISKDGRSITCYRFPQASPESFHVYLLGQALSFALVKNGIEPLHATVVVIDGKAVAFLGDCGFGKSTLAAEFLRAGHRLLTDDLLVLRATGRRMLAYPGPPRIKLFPELARRFLADEATGVPMNPDTRKLVIPLNQDRACGTGVPLAAVYALASPDKMAAERNIRITALSPREAFLRILASAFNILILHAPRLRRHFEATEALANSITVKELSYPRTLECLPMVRGAILSDLLGNQSEARPCVA
jgi:hypothetical protein